MGAGLQGRRRAESITSSPRASLAAVTSRDPVDAEALTARHGGRVLRDWPELGPGDGVDAVFVCTPPDSHLDVALHALAAGKHVLVEKPMARTAADAAAIVTAAAEAVLVAQCGFNHRFHPAVAALKVGAESGALGRPYFFRCAYGIAGRPGYEKEWRFDPRVVSGGHLVEQGIHALDLVAHLGGPIVEVTGACATSHWDVAPFEDNAMVLARCESGAVASVHASLTQWVNLFRLEAGYEHAVAVVEGLGGGYGEERLSVWRRTDGPFSAAVTSFRGGDVSWRDELHAFADLVDGAAPAAPPREHPGVAALRVAEQAYAADAGRAWLSTKP